MSETQSTAVDARLAAKGGDDSELLDWLLVLAKHKKLIVGLPLAVAFVASLFVMSLPNIYKASTKLMPPQQSQSAASAILSQLGGMAGMASGIAGMKNPNDMYIGMLRSRAVADSLVTKFELTKRYETKSTEMARFLLGENTMISAGKDGLITIDFEDKDQKLVANVANAYVSELLKLTRTLAVTEAAQRRVFFERQLDISKKNLESAEVTLKGALDSRGVLSVDGNSRAIIETVARVRAQISAKQIQVASMQAFVTASNPDYMRAREELISLRSELHKLENGRPAAEDKMASGSEQVGLANVRILRDLKYHQMLYELLAKQYEIARLDEAKDAPLIQVLDAAIEPESKFKPKRAILVFVATVLAFFAAVTLVLLMEMNKRAMRSPARSEKLKALKAAFRRK
jgi:tyrosine-protein kinase Etk/Wzc